MGYNKGDSYEQSIFDLLSARGLIATDSTRGGAGNSTDIKFLYDSQEYNLEVKLDLEADYGQKMLRWDDGHTRKLNQSIPFLRLQFHNPKPPRSPQSRSQAVLIRRCTCSAIVLRFCKS